MSKQDLTDPGLYINRELSQLSFNKRVLNLAKDSSIPLVERLNYVFIVSSNLDEFFEIRVSGLKEKIAYGSHNIDADGLSLQQTLTQISEQAHALVDEQYHVLNKLLIPALQQQQIFFLQQEQWQKQQANWIRHYFRSEILPIISPIALDLAHPFPRLGNKSLNFVVTLKGKDSFGRDSGLAIVHVPRTIPRIIPLPDDVCSGGENFTFISSIINAFASELFSGMNVTGCYQICLTRNSDLLVDEEEVDDLIHAIKTELLTKRYGNAVRLEVAHNCPEYICDFLLKKHGLTEQDLYRVEGPLNLSRFKQFIKLIHRPDLKFPLFNAGLPAGIEAKHNLFETLQKQDILLHHPYQTFGLVVELIHQAAKDPNVIAIKQTLYRTEANSMIVNALVEAARARKEITAVVELRARFDEEENITLANRLQDAGALVVYGVLGFKTHGKMLMVVRREGKKLRRYVHLSTGNYHPSTTMLYTDLGFLTSNDDIGNDVQKIFQQLTGMGKATDLKKLLYAPFTLHTTLLQLIDQEIAHAKQGKHSEIIIKVNSLTDTTIIQALYKASQQGVKIQLIIRGICCLRPGIKGISDNITVKSIVGQFLEHTRIYYFANDRHPKLYCSSADCMERSFFKRVEICFPIENKQLAKRVMDEGLLIYLKDNAQCWTLESDGQYHRQATTSATCNAQTQLLAKLSN